MSRLMVAAYGGDESPPLEAILAQMWLKGGCVVNPDDFDGWPIDRVLQWRTWANIFREIENPSG